MSIEIKYEDFENKHGVCAINQKPDTCPICGTKINPEIMFSYKRNEDYGGYEYLELVLKCTDQECNHLFIGYYSSFSGHSSINRDYFTLDQAGLKFYESLKKFPEIICIISPKFSPIYNQAYLAEENGLNEICGPGYRRSLEFLVRDYLIHNKKGKKEEIKESQLSQAIGMIDDARIKACAERAAWLGNDETHYTRKFEDRDLGDLKNLIKLTVNWIENDELSKEYLKMESKKS